ncbi:MAG: hypothetical protein IJ966_06150 [Bacilli bacterium]|nr:hypothetical protein [Bacilli bacterium]
MKLRETLYFAKKLVIGASLGRIQMLSKPMNFSSNVELSMKCKLFSEGNSLLSDALYHLNDIGLNTFACCKGHTKKGGYIAFVLNEENKELVSKMCGYLLDNTNISLQISPHHYNVEGISVAIYFSVEERKKVLDRILNISLDENNSTNRIVDEMIELSELQNCIHSDMTYGIYLKKDDGAYNIETDPVFLMRSLDRYISVTGLERVCASLGDLTEEIDGKSIAPIHLLKRLERTNSRIKDIICSDENELHDYYPTFTEEELLRVMEINALVPGRLEELMKKANGCQLSLEEEDYYCMFIESEDLYFLTLKLEESLAYKRQSITLQEEKRVL